MLAIFLDLPKASDTMWKYKIVATLYNWQFRGPTLLTIANFLSNQLFNVRIGDRLPLEHNLENGVP